jgi:hypothetical protein
MSKLLSARFPCVLRQPNEKKGESLSTVGDKIRTPVEFSYCILGPISGGFTLIVSGLWFLLLYRSDQESLYLIYPHFLIEQSQFLLTYIRVLRSTVRTCQHKCTQCTEKIHDDKFMISLETDTISTQKLSKQSFYHGYCEDQRKVAFVILQHTHSYWKNWCISLYTSRIICSVDMWKQRSACIVDIVFVHVYSIDHK